MRCFKVGFREGEASDPQRRNWSDDGPRPSRWSAWYPARNDAVEHVVTIPTASPLFVMGSVAREAPLSTDQERFPVVLLSHGTGGTASSLGWLAQHLASAGFLVIGADHHGNTASEPYRPEGFLCWWERPRDLSVILDQLMQTGPFAGRMDLERVSAAGFSLGGYTVMSLAGAITDMSHYREWAGESRFARGPREFPDVVDHIEGLLDQNPIFKASWESQTASNYDARIKSFIALAPAPTRALTLQSLQDIHAPVTIIVGEGDTEAPADLFSVWMHEQLPRSSLHLLGRDVGHYTFLCECTEAGKDNEPALCQDQSGINRASVHEMAAGIALSALRVTGVS